MVMVAQHRVERCGGAGAYAARPGGKKSCVGGRHVWPSQFDCVVVGSEEEWCCGLSLTEGIEVVQYQASAFTFLIFNHGRSGAASILEPSPDKPLEPRKNLLLQPCTSGYSGD